MGFLKNLKSNLTGDWAQVSAFVEPVRRGESANVTIDVVVKDNPITVDAVVVEVVCREVVHIPNYRAAGVDRPIDAHANESLYDHKVTVAQAQQLEAGGQAQFTAAVAIPGHLPASFVGRNARVEWQLRARLDMKGNDPDSGWQDLQVQ